MNRVIRGSINRFLDAVPRLTWGTATDRRALLSFVMCPPGPWEGVMGSYYQGCHNNRLQSRLMVEVLRRHGYGVVLQHCSRPVVLDPDRFALFIGHHKTFSLAASAYLDGPNVLITTGRSPTEDRLRLTKRWAHLLERHPHAVGLSGWLPQDVADYGVRNFSVAQWIFLIGGPPVAETWPASRARIRYYHNVSPFPRRRKKGRTNSFLFVAGVNSLRRGLDLVLDVFSQRSEDLYICAPYERDDWFMQIYGARMRERCNIHPLGIVDTAGSQFSRLLDRCDFVIYPSCSEGESGSVINAARNNLIPVVTPEAGLPDACGGVLIQGDRLQHVADAVERAVQMSDAEIGHCRDDVYNKTEAYDPEAFMDVFSRFLEEVGKAGRTR